MLLTDQSRRALLYTSFFVIVWASTFGAAFVNGDDVYHLSRFGASFHNVFLPEFKPYWIANRVVDMYVRNLTTAIFDFVFFPLQFVTGIEFVTFYRIFSATIFAIFLTCVYGYIINLTNLFASTEPGTEKDFTYATFMGLLLAVMLLTIFTWRNQTHLISYQLPAFLSFVLIVEFYKIATSCFCAKTKVASHDGLSSRAHSHTSYNGKSAIILLSFVCAFSLEVYSATILLVLCITWVVILLALYSKNCANMPVTYVVIRSRLLRFTFLSISAITFFLLSLYIAVHYSRRIARSSQPEFFSNLLNINSNVIKESEAYQFVAGNGLSILGFISLIFLISIVTKSIFNKRISIPKIERMVSYFWHKSKKNMVAFYFAITAILLSNLTLTMLVSAKTGKNYFSSLRYPWGDLLLVSKIALVALVLILLRQVPMKWYTMRNVLVLLMFIVSSGFVITFLENSNDSYTLSMQIENSYHKALSSSAVTIDSGLSLDTNNRIIEISKLGESTMLPTENTSQWWNKAFNKMFSKYYHIEHNLVFR